MTTPCSACCCSLVDAHADHRRRRRLPGGGGARGERPANGFPADQDHGGPGWYRRCNRAHLNCVENLPVFGAVVLVGAAAGVSTPLLATLAQVYLGARILQSLIHILSTSTWAVNLRFAFFSAQLVCVFAMAWEIWSAA